MKKLVSILMLLVAVPAMALTLTVTDQGGGVARIAYEKGATALPAGFGLKVTVSAGTITAVDPAFEGVGAGYGIFPGTISIDANGTIVDVGSPVADPCDPGAGGGIGTNNVVLEMGSLHDDGNVPSDNGVLCDVTVSESCTLCVTTEPIRGNIVLEDLSVVEINEPGVCAAINLAPPECVKSTAPFYSNWVALGKPNCWCYSRNCRGDINGIKSGPYWVSSLDLDAFRLAFNDSTLEPGEICADNNRIKSGPYWVSSLDLDTFRLYFNKLEASVPVCDQANYNFWTTP